MFDAQVFQSSWFYAGLEILITNRLSILHSSLFCYRLSQMLCFQFFLSIIAFSMIFAYILLIGRMFTFFLVESA